MDTINEIKDWLKEPAPDNGEDDGFAEIRGWLRWLLSEREQINAALSVAREALEYYHTTENYARASIVLGRVAVILGQANISAEERADWDRRK